VAYLTGNPRTKKQAKEMLARGETEPYQPGIGVIPRDGTVALEGPHYPEAHRWYANGVMKNGELVRIR
jgi:alkylated DNA nucleotide flippase Atl1